MNSVQYLKQIPANSVCSEDNVLTDEQLRSGGLEKIEGWTRTEKTRSAARTAKHREKRSREGRKQLNLVAPIELHQLLRDIAKTGKIPEEVVREVQVEVVREVPAPLILGERHCLYWGARLLSLPRWRRILIYLLSRFHRTSRIEFFNKFNEKYPAQSSGNLPGSTGSGHEK